MLWIMLALMMLVLPLRWVLSAVIAALVHELGHFIALRLCHVPVHGLRIGVGGAFMQIGQMTPGQTIICALAGPAAGLLLMLLAPWMPRIAVCAFIHSAYNLLPIYPLDGGRVLNASALPPWVCGIAERGCLIAIFLAGILGCILFPMGLLPLFVSLLILRRAIAGKGLEMRREFRYNRERFNERGNNHDRFTSQNSSHGAKTGKVHRRRI